MYNQDPTVRSGDSPEIFIDLPEWQLLVGDNIVASPEASQSDSAAEAKRTQCSLNCLTYIYEGGHDNYQALTAVQNEDVKLGHEEFEELHSWFQQVLPDDNSYKTMQYIMLIHDSGKNPCIYDEMGIDKHSMDHDEVLDALISAPEYEDQRANLLPTLATFSEDERRIIENVFKVRLNFGQFLQAEAPAAALQGIPEDLDEQSRAYYVMHAMLDIAGVAGHINSDSSLILTSPTYKSMMAANAALTDEYYLDASQRFDAYISYRASQLGIAPEEMHGESAADSRARVRLACMLRLDSAEQLTGLTEEYNQLSDQARTVLETELNRNGIHDRATLPYYGPALLKALSNKTDLQTGLAYFAHVLYEAHRADEVARSNGETGMITAELGDLARAINQGELDPQRSSVRFALKESMLIPSIVSQA